MEGIACADKGLRQHMIIDAGIPISGAVFALEYRGCDHFLSGYCADNTHTHHDFGIQL